MNEDDVVTELISAIQLHEAQHVQRTGRRPDFDVVITTEFRKRILRRIGWDENRPISTDETVFGHRVTVDDGLPAGPGFTIRDNA